MLKQRKKNKLSRRNRNVRHKRKWHYMALLVSNIEFHIFWPLIEDLVYQGDWFRLGAVAIGKL